MEESKHGYKSSINSDAFSEINPLVSDMIINNNPSEFNYLSLSIRNHKRNTATSVPSNKGVVIDYLNNNLIEIDPLSCFERFTDKKIVTFYEIGKYKNHGKNGEAYLEKRRKSGLNHGFHYIHRHKNWSFTIVLATDFKKQGFATDESLMIKNSEWINNIIKSSLLILNENKGFILQENHDSNTDKEYKNNVINLFS